MAAEGSAASPTAVDVGSTSHVLVVVEHAVKHDTVSFKVPEDSSLQGVLELLAANRRRPDISKKGKLVRRQGNQAFISLKHTDKLGKKRHLLLMGVPDLEVGSGIPIEAALKMQLELNARFAEREFQQQLLELEWTWGATSPQFVRERIELTLGVQKEVLPKYGFEGSHAGVAEMMDALKAHHQNEEFLRNTYITDQLLRTNANPSVDTKPDRLVKPEQPNSSEKHEKPENGTKQAGSTPKETRREDYAVGYGIPEDDEVLPSILMNSSPPAAVAVAAANALVDSATAPAAMAVSSSKPAAAAAVVPTSKTASSKAPAISKTVLSGVKIARVRAPAPGEVCVVRTSRVNGEKLSEMTPLKLKAQRRSGEASVVVDASVHYQTFLGFGGSFTQTSSDLFKGLSEPNQKRIIDGCFSAEAGLGYRLGRLHINSCDFSSGNWSCCNLENDTHLSSFSLFMYDRSIVPFIRMAEEAAGQSLKLLASPWSPPAWMKDNSTMIGGGSLKPEYRQSWADFYVRFAKDMEERNLKLWGITVQNEPLATTGWENCVYSAEEERDFVRDFLGPTIQEHARYLKLLVWDHNRDEMLARARVIYADAKAARYVWGLGFHWYGDPRYEKWPDRAGQVCFDNVARVHELRPDKHLVMTEACQEGGPHTGEWGVGERYAENIIKDLNNWTEAWIDWNLLLDEQGGPNHAGNFCSAPLHADVSRDLVIFQPSYYYIGHFSRYISPGAQRIMCAASRDALQTTAFENPDGTIVVVVLNTSSLGIFFWLDIAGQAAHASAPRQSITTFLCRPASPES